MPPTNETERQSKFPNDLHRRFQYHPPKPGQPEIYQQIRDEAHGLACLICQLSPPSREQSLALTKIEEAVMWANAGIARNEA